MKKLSIFLLILMPGILSAQGVMTPELLWSLGRVRAISQSPDGANILYAVAKTNIKTEKSATSYYLADIASGNTSKFTALKGYDFVQWDPKGLYATKDSALMKSTDNGTTWTTVSDKMKDVTNIRVSPDGKWIAFSKDIDGEKVLGKDIYPDASKSTAQIYTDLNYRHWDKWNFGKLSHVFVMPADGSAAPKDILEGQPYDCPQQPFGGAEDFIFSPDSKSVLYVCKKKVGKEYAQSTNTDIYNYDIASGNTANITEGMMGYDIGPRFSHDGKKLAWLSMKTDGYESDKNDIVVMDWANKQKMNLTAGWDETVDGGFAWSNDDKNIYFNASIKGTDQLFSVMVPANLMARIMPAVQQQTKGDFDITGIAAQSKNTLVVTRTDFNHATELYKLDLKNMGMMQLSHANDSAYSKIKMSKSELRMVTTTDGKQMGVWVIYPPDFDATKKYPTLLYCQGGPQSALTQFYSVRWNFQLMAANGYIIVAPNRRGMPGWGVQWNAAISKDWGGQPMQDYLAAIDDVAKEPYVDKNRLGCVGASYGGYSVYMLAGIHNNRFKTFIAHDGLFDMKSWYGTTEELWFANWDLGGNYWQNPSPESYTRFNPSNYIDKWNTPIMIIQGGIDFRVPIEQGFEAFQAAQLKGIKSKILYFPNENHWVLHCHNGLVWQRAFFDWLKETL